MRRLTLDVLDARRCPLKRTTEPEVFWLPFDACGHPGVASLVCSPRHRDDFPEGCPLAPVAADDPAAIADAEAQRRKIRWPLSATVLKSRVRRRLEGERAAGRVFGFGGDEDSVQECDPWDNDGMYETQG